MTAYYNEIDPYAAQWLRNLISAGHIAPGVVDERSITEIDPNEIKRYTQCHFFAGIGVWSHALRKSGWRDTNPVWTGSCPCQPFSSAGKGGGFDDPRHLWPVFNRLIAECKPPVVFGEQVASKAVDPWFDLVQDDLESMGYAFGAVPFPAASVGSPNIRDRAYWGAVRLGNSDLAGLERLARNDCSTQRESSRRPAPTASLSSGLAHPHGVQQRQVRIGGSGNEYVPGGRDQGSATNTGFCSAMRAGPTNGFWADTDWLGCRDDKWRPVEPGTFPLANGVACRVGRLRAYGNALNAEAARAFIGCFIEIEDELL